MSHRHHSSDEVHQEYESAMGPELGGLVWQLYNECAWLHIAWIQYVELFGTSQQRIDLLMGAAALTFRVVHDSLWDGTLLQLCRLTDSERSFRSEPRLTVRRLPALVAPASRAHIAAALEALRDVLNGLENHYRRATVAYELVPQPQGAVDLLYVLHAGLEAQEAQRRRLQGGKALPEDLQPPPLL